MLHLNGITLSTKIHFCFLLIGKKTLAIFVTKTILISKVTLHHLSVQNVYEQISTQNNVNISQKEKITVLVTKEWYSTVHKKLLSNEQLAKKCYSVPFCCILLFPWWDELKHWEQF